MRFVVRLEFKSYLNIFTISVYQLVIKCKLQINLGRTTKMLTTGFCMLEAGETQEGPKKVKLSLEKPGSIWLPDVPRYKQVGLFTFKKAKASEVKRRANSRLATLDISRLMKAEWSSFEARVKVSVTWHRRAKNVIFVRLQDFLSQLLTEDSATQIFILHVNKRNVVMWHCMSLSGGEECDHVHEELKANDEENEHITTERSESNEEQADGDGEWNTDTDEEYFSLEEKNKSLSDEEYATGESDEEEHSNSDEEYFSFEEDAIEESVEDEAVLSLTLPQEPHVKDATTDGAAKEQNKRQEKRKPCRAKADVGLLFGVMHVHGQDPDAPTEAATQAEGLATCERGEGAAA